MYILGLLTPHQFLLLTLFGYSYESHNIPCRVAEEEEGSASLANLWPQYSLKVNKNICRNG